MLRMENILIRQATSGGSELMIVAVIQNSRFVRALP